jgi:hypothetical protein
MEKLAARRSVAHGKRLSKHRILMINLALTWCGAGRGSGLAACRAEHDTQVAPRQLTAYSRARLAVGARSQQILEPNVPHSLRLQGILIGGVVLCFSKQQGYLLEDLKEMWVSWAVWRAVGTSAFAGPLVNGMTGPWQPLQSRVSCCLSMHRGHLERSLEHVHLFARNTLLTSLAHGAHRS